MGCDGVVFGLVASARAVHRTKPLDPVFFCGCGCGAANGDSGGLPSAGVERVDSMQDLADEMNICLLAQKQGVFR
jgi:hypothetical protein